MDRGSYHRHRVPLNERYTEIAAELVRLKVDVIVTSGPAVLSAKQATSGIPIVFAVANDPIATGMIASLARPGGNVTGLSIQNTETAAISDPASRRLRAVRRHFMSVVTRLSSPTGPASMS